MEISAKSECAGHIWNGPEKKKSLALVAFIFFLFKHCKLSRSPKDCLCHWVSGVCSKTMEATSCYSHSGLSCLCRRIRTTCCTTTTTHFHFAVTEEDATKGKQDKCQSFARQRAVRPWQPAGIPQEEMRSVSGNLLLVRSLAAWWLSPSAQRETSSCGWDKGGRSWGTSH